MVARAALIGLSAIRGSSDKREGRIMGDTGKRAVIGLGSNLGDCIETIEGALESIADIDGVMPLAVSSIYKSEPAYYEDQETFYNAVCIVTTTLEPLDLLHALQGIENDFRRTRSFKNAPRTLDLDIIDIEGIESDDTELLLPHPLAFERGFVITPLLEIAPDFMFANGVLADDCNPLVGLTTDIAKPREDLAF